MTDTLPQRLGRAFRKRREALGFSQESYADEIGMHRTYYSAIERGEKNLQLDTLQKVRKLPRQADISKVELSACRMRYSAGVSPPSESWGLSSL